MLNPLKSHAPVGQYCYFSDLVWVSYTVACWCAEFSWVWFFSSFYFLLSFFLVLFFAVLIVVRSPLLLFCIFFHIFFSLLAFFLFFLLLLNCFPRFGDWRTVNHLLYAYPQVNASSTMSGLYYTALSNKRPLSYRCTPWQYYSK